MRRRWLAGIFAFSAAWAILVAVVTNDRNHQLWGDIAAVGYGLALLTVLAVRHTRMADIALALAFLGGLVVPLAYLAASNQMQPEVGVVYQSGWNLLHHGTPYLSGAGLRRTGDPINHYNPYLPLMALFGVPSALFGLGPFTDPRVWFGVVFVAVFWLALRRGGAGDPGRWLLLVAGSPIIAFELAVGGTDVPMVAFLCLGFAYLWARKPVMTGLALGIASAMKATAWPALLVGAALLWVTAGRRAVRNFALAAVAIVVVCVGPFIAVHPRALITNTIKFPLGLAGIESAARSPLPGYLIASTGHLGHTIVIALLGLAGLAVAVSLLVRPPRTVPRAVLLLAGAMTLMFVLAPSTRVGYFIYPAALVIWLLVVRAERQATADDELSEIEVGFLPARVPEVPPAP
jgi:hypothetical protein